MFEWRRVMDEWIFDCHSFGHLVLNYPPHASPHNWRPITNAASFISNASAKATRSPPIGGVKRNAALFSLRITADDWWSCVKTWSKMSRQCQLDIIFNTFMHYLIKLCAYRTKVAENVISAGMSMKRIVLNNGMWNLENLDAIASRKFNSYFMQREIAFFTIFCDNFRPEESSDVLSSKAVDNVVVRDVQVKYDRSPSLTILELFVELTSSWTTTHSQGNLSY